MTSLHLIIAVAVVLTAIGVTAYLLHKKLAYVLDRIDYRLHATEQIAISNIDYLSRDIKAHAREMADQVASVVIAPVQHLDGNVKRQLDAVSTVLHTAVLDSREHTEAGFSKITAEVHASASKAVHEAIGVVRGIKHETCQLCGKVANIWKIVEGKIECADCSIRKMVS